MRRAACLLLMVFAGAAGAAPSESCARIAEETQRAEQARKAAVEKGDNAWKAIVPFVVLARKASSKTAVEEADRQLATLREQAVAEGCEVRP